MTWTTFVRTHVKITVYKTKYITKEKYPITGLVTEKKRGIFFDDVCLH